MVPWHEPAARILARAPAGIILSGGPRSVREAGAPRCERGVLDAGVPVLGICYGMQLMTDLLGGEVEAAPNREYGPATVTPAEPRGALFDGLAGVAGRVGESRRPGGGGAPGVPGRRRPAPTRPWRPWTTRAGGSTACCSTPRWPTRRMGRRSCADFAFSVCGCRGDWNIGAYVDEAVARIRAQVGGGRVICALSGGVDSTVAALLIHRAIGERLTCVFVDNGVLRLDEAAQVKRRLAEKYQLPVVAVDASDRFLAALAGVTDPEQKRKIIGRVFIEVFDEEAARLGGFDFLGQGTLYPDVIESVSVVGPSAAIKSHHNVGGLPETMRLTLVEPLRQLFKDEVRALGRAIGLDEEFVARQPFPGPGLAVRIVGEVTRERLDLLRRADAVVVEEIKRQGWYGRLWQSFAVLLPVRSVGVMGDERTYDATIAVRAVESRDGMTADWARLPHDLLATRVVAGWSTRWPGINRVVYDISSKPPSTIEWE